MIWRIKHLSLLYYIYKPGFTFFFSGGFTAVSSCSRLRVVSVTVAAVVVRTAVSMWIGVRVRGEMVRCGVIEGRRSVAISAMAMHHGDDWHGCVVDRDGMLVLVVPVGAE